MREIVTEIERRRQQLVASKENEQLAPMEDFAGLAGLSVSTIYGWRGKKPTSPSFIDLRACALLVGCDVKLVEKGGKEALGSESGQGAVNVTDLTKQVVAMMESMSDSDRKNVHAFAMSYLRVYGAQGPTEPVEGKNGSSFDRTNETGPA